MMKNRRNSQRRRLQVLCEDRETARFVEHIATRWGIGERQRQIDTSPEGRGSGEQYVQRHFIEAIMAWRRVRHENVLLLIVIDGDNYGVQKRRNQLAQLLRDNQEVPISEKDPIAIIVPTWHIETWIAWLCGHRPIDEQIRYNGRDAAGLDVQHKIEHGVYTAKLAIAAWDPPAPDESTYVPSLTEARKELAVRFGF
jgi:hypothetical protein